jgi:predicted esterase
MSGRDEECWNPYWNCGMIATMKILSVVILLGGLIWPVESSRAEEEFFPGKEADFLFKQVLKPLVVYLPVNYDATKAWPVVFHYHGTGADPNVAIPRAYTGGKDFVLVGMEYATLRKKPTGEDYLATEILFLRAVRKALAEKVNIIPRRSYVGGFSKGGWFASEFAERYSKDFSGVYILGAGKKKPDKRRTRAITMGMPLFIGTGQQDINYFYSIVAISHFSQLGGRVTYDEYLGMRHGIPMGIKFRKSEHFSQWWAIEAGRPEPSLVREAAVRWSEKGLAHALGISAEMDKLLFLQKLRSAPFYALLEGSQREGIDNALAAMLKLPQLRKELAAQRDYRVVLKRELGGNGMEHLLEIAHEYGKVNATYKDQHFGKRAGMELLRVTDMVHAAHRWNWPSEEKKQAVMAKLKEEPPPEVDREPLEDEFERLHRMLDRQ